MPTEPCGMDDALIGVWEGRVQTWFEPTSEPVDAPAHGKVVSHVQGRALTFGYHWSLHEDAHEGVLLLAKTEGAYQASWVDSFHTAGDLMQLKGDGDRLSVSTAYGPPDEPWGWRFELTTSGDTLTWGHFNRPPGEDEYLAVQFQFSRC